MSLDLDAIEAQANGLRDEIAKTWRTGESVPRAVLTVAEECSAILGLVAEVRRLRHDLKMAEERRETWKAQAGRDQQENRVLKAQMQGKHCTAVNRADLFEAHTYPVPELVMFLRELVKRADADGMVTPGKWRAKELSQSADRMEEMYESYLAECPHEIEVERLRAEVSRTAHVRPPK